MSYSQTGEDLIIKAYFDSIGVKNGVLLDLGANDGVTFSNSRSLLLNGWSGCLVEPTSAYNALSDLYTDNKNVKTLQAAIGTNTEIGCLRVAPDTLVSSVHKELTDVWHLQIFENIEIQFYSVSDMLKEFDTYHFDFITIDCEGLDWEILQQMDLNALGCMCLCIEYWKYEKEITEYCNSYGLKLLHKNGENLIMVR